MLDELSRLGVEIMNRTLGGIGEIQLYLFIDLDAKMPAQHNLVEFPSSNLRILFITVSIGHRVRGTMPANADQSSVARPCIPVPST